MISRLLAALAGALLAPGLALAAGTVTPELRSAAQSVTYSTQELVNTLRSVAPADQVVYQVAAMTQAAQRFEQEEDAAPQNLPGDYRALQQQYSVVSGAIYADYAISGQPLVRDAWKGVQESMSWLAQAWSQSPQPQPNPQPPYPQPQPNPQPNPQPPYPQPQPQPPYPQPQPQPRPVVCYAQNLRGQVFQATGWNVAQTQSAAIQYCQAHSLLACKLRGCQYY